MRIVAGLLMVVAGCSFDPAGPAPDEAQPGDRGPTMSVTCPAGYDEAPTGSCYRLDTGRADWETALASCEADAVDAHLVVIDDAFENALLGELIGGEEVWTGLTRMGESSSFQWVTGEAPEFFAWESDAPNDQRCVILRNEKSPASWDDKDCPSSFAFVCEADPR